MDKSELRNTVLRRRQTLASQEVIMLSRQITKRLRNFVDFSKVYKLHIYTSQPKLNEVDTSEICHIISKEFPAIAITKGSSSKHALIPSDQFDLVIVPLIAFDDTCNRIGFGGGWYDRFLSTQPKAQKIGLAYELQRIDYVPIEPHDVPLDVILTEGSTTYTPNKNTLPK